MLVDQCCRLPHSLNSDSIYTQSQACIHTYIHTYTYVCMHIHIRVHNTYKNCIVCIRRRSDVLWCGVFRSVGRSSMSPVGEWFMIILSQAPTLPSNDALLLRFQVLYSQYQRPTKRHDLHNPSRSRQSLSLVGTLCKQFVSAIDELLFSKLRFINMRLLSPVYRRILG